MKNKFLCILLVLMLTFSAVACTQKPTENNNNNPTENNQTDGLDLSGTLDVLRSDKKVTQDQMMSRIKAEYLKENNGYKPQDDVVVMVTLKDDALIDTYNSSYHGEAQSVSEYAKTFQGSVQAENLKQNQQNVISELLNRGLIDSVEYSYSVIMNGFAVNTKYGNIKDINNVKGVKSTFLSDTYNLPMVTESKSVGNAITNPVDVYETGIYKSDVVKFTGENTSVAILDSGFDCSHSVFTSALEKGRMQTPMFSKDDINKFFTEKTEENHLKAFDGTKDLEVTDVYHNKKIPFAYDYADKDPDVFPYDSSHGTHVAGIIGGKDDVITGIAINTQLVLMKVFPDLSEGGDSMDIMAALEDAVMIGVDAINMSLGSSCGFVTEKDKLEINKVYEKIGLSGISLITAASNSFSSGFGGAQGNTNFVTNPDSGTVGAPSTYNAALSVASIDGKKRKYLVANGKDVVFFDEANKLNGDPYNFFEMLNIGNKPGMLQEKEFEYVTIPGIGSNVNYSSIGYKPAKKDPVTGEYPQNGKIALVRRGTNTFEEKALIAKQHGFSGCIIYNNIDGEILMSMGKKKPIATISISKDNGMLLAQKKTGKLLLKTTNEAGPFMSDFSSWGPTPSLTLKPEITAHGGNIHSAVPGGGYEDMSGTSMATPNLCGVVVLIRQYLKEKYPIGTLMPGSDANNADVKKTYAVKINNLLNQLLMSTATIARNEEGVPYSPRKQGAGLASLKNAVTTGAYITVDGTDRTKIELGDDKNKTGVYTMNFNVVNISDKAISYDLSLVGMTETVAKFDKKHVAETDQIFEEAKAEFSVNGKKVNNITVPNGETLKVTAKFTLSDKEKRMLNELFPYGMYVEGFVKLTNNHENVVNLNVPFLGFYGDWTEAPLFDKTYFEVESEAFNGAIDEEDKIKADYYATTPYGTYFYNYMIPLGKYIYDIDTNIYDAIPASTEKVAISNTYGAIDGISTVFAGLLRNAAEMEYTIVDKVTGEVVWDFTDRGARKAYSAGGGPSPYFNFFRMSPYHVEDKNSEGTLHQALVNNRQYQFKMVGKLDYGDGGLTTNVRNQFDFDFYMDNEAPVLKEVWYEKEYDKTKKKNRYYINMVVYDNHYVQSISPIIFTSSSSYTFLAKDPIPVYGERGEDTKVRFEITDYLEDVGYDKVIQNGLSFSIDDYALNSNIFICQLPGTKGDFKFTEDGTMDGSKLNILSAKQNQVVNLVKYLATADKTVDSDKDYLKYLEWTSSDESIATVKEGLVKCLKPGRAVITATERMDGKQAVIIINVKEENVVAATQFAMTQANFGKDDINNFNDKNVKSVRFSHFETLRAHSLAGQTSEIGKTGDVRFISSTGTISLYPGEKIKLFHDFDPWYVEDAVDKDGNLKYEKSYESTLKEIASVNEKGEVEALSKGNTKIVLNLKNSYIKAIVNIEVKDPFVIENRTLIAYKGVGGDVVIPDDEGILFIAPYAFCLYETDQKVHLTEEDYDANKIPQENNTIKSVTIPEGIEDIKKYAFYNCKALEKVILPKSLKYVREYAFHGNGKLNNVDLKDTTVVGAHAFEDCKSLTNIKMPKIYAIGECAFKNCVNLESVDLVNLRNTGKEAFKDCKNLTNVKMGQFTKLAPAMFMGTGLTNVELYEKDVLPEYCFARCANLVSVTFLNDLVAIEQGAFGECTELTTVKFKGVEQMEGKIFYGDRKLKEITLPNSEFTFGELVFYDSGIEKINFAENTLIKNIKAATFKKVENLNKFVVDVNNKHYSVSEDGKYLLNKAGDTIIFVLTKDADGNVIDYTNLVIDDVYTAIGDGAFSGLNIVTLEVKGTNKFTIGNFAFSNCESLSKVIFPENGNIIVGEHAFDITENLNEVVNSSSIKEIGAFGFAGSGKLHGEEIKAESKAETDGKEPEKKYQPFVVANGTKLGDAAFVKSKIAEITIGENVAIPDYAFQSCKFLVTVNLPESGGITVGKYAFSYAKNLSSFDFLKITGDIPEAAFLAARSLTKADLGNIKNIGKYAFADCSSLNEINFNFITKDEKGDIVSTPGKIERIGEGAFSKNEGYAPGVKTLVFPATIKQIDKGAFLFCDQLRSVEFAEGAEITAIKEYTFLGCSVLSKVVLSENITEIGELAFGKTPSLGKIETVGGDAKKYSIDLRNIKTIGKGAFIAGDRRSELGGRVNLANLVELGEQAFELCTIEDVYAPNLTKIGMGAFIDNALKSFTFNNNVEYIGTMAFKGNSLLKTFKFIDGDGKEKTEGQFGKDGYAKLVKGGLYVKLETGMWQLSSIPAQLFIDESLALKDKEDKTIVFEVAPETTRIDVYAGNENTYITKLIFPDGLMLIGNFAFFGCKGLKEVEFRSELAPTLESVYNRNSKLEKTDPGYEYLHMNFDIMGFEFCYNNFIDLVGKKAPIKMVLPSNKAIKGYNSMVYEAYFGKVEDAERTDYVSMEENLIKFLKYAKQINNIKEVTLAHEKLVNDAVTVYMSLTQKGTDFGIPEQNWNAMVNKSFDYKNKVDRLKVEKSSQDVKDTQKLIDALPETFDVTVIAKLKEVIGAVKNLEKDKKEILITEKYKKLMAEYDKYLSDFANEQQIIDKTVDSISKRNNAGTAAAVVGATTLLTALVAFVLKRKLF